MEKGTFYRLKQHMIDVIAEQQLKIGYMNEWVSLYYPTDSVLQLLGMSDMDKLMSTLLEYKVYAKPVLGDIEVSYDKDVFCFRISPQGGTYVHEIIADGSSEKLLFLRDFLEMIVRHNQTIEDIKGVFLQYSEHVIVKKMNDAEFDYLIYFSEGIPDNYRYCIRFEGAHATYHRFLPEDYARFSFETET